MNTPRPYIQKHNMFQPLTQRGNGYMTVSLLLGLYDIMSQKIDGKCPEGEVLSSLKATYIASSESCDTEPAIQKARNALAVLLKHNYLEFEHVNLGRNYMFTKEGMDIVLLLGSLELAEEQEYASDLLSMYNTLTNDKAFQHPYFGVIMPVYTSTQRIEAGLRKLQADIRSRISNTMRHVKMQELCDELNSVLSEDGPFDKFIRFYNEALRLGISEFVPSKMRTIESDEDLLAKAVSEYQSAKSTRTEKLSTDEARRGVTMLLHSIIDEYENGGFQQKVNIVMDNIREYCNRAARRSQMATIQPGMSLSENLRYIAAHIDRIPEDRDLGECLHLYQTSLFDPCTYAIPHRDPPLESRVPENEITADALKDLYEKEKHRQENGSFNEINKRMFEMFGEKGQVTDEDFPLQTEENIKFLCSLISYADRDGRCYDIIVSGDWTENEYGRYNKFQINRIRGRK